MIRLTPEQREAVEHNGNLLLTACPGSGKTRVILAKLLTLADQVVGTPQFIGCITYTNAAHNQLTGSASLATTTPGGNDVNTIWPA